MPRAEAHCSSFVCVCVCVCVSLCRGGARRHTVIVLSVPDCPSVCLSVTLSVTSFSRRSLKTKR